MSSTQNEQHLVKSIQRFLQLTSGDHSYVIYRVLMLSDAMHSLLFCQLSFDLNLQLEAVHGLFADLSTKYLYVARPSTSNSSSSQRHDIEAQSENDSRVSKKQRTTKQKDKVPLSQFKNQFSETLKSIVAEFEEGAAQMTDKEVCLALTKHFLSHNQNLFWERVQSTIAYKTKLQLKEFFQKSFAKCQFEQISEADKLKLKELAHAMPRSKPSEIVDVFFGQSGSEAYFRRTMVMFIQYQKRIDVQ
ncbi:Hypothetical_protein [Hexamita inflata]|uniref:Hypothetical_protein n=1 Tax=Hexamita inflata TaxID=28002 RepID=A0AA86NTS9_9EUKA|nr:Hypothetical protein HINF_LOCUS13234 [Hexamita inflata]CAI9966733.1 Hypothetical protein HINF_LOCUS54378 [Hexamita inflata]